MVGDFIMNQEARFVLLAYALRFDNDWSSIFDAIKKSLPISDDEYERAVKFPCNFISIVDNEYPSRIKHGFRPPFVIYYEGDLDILNRVDEEPNDLVFLYGKNVHHIPQENLCCLEDDGKFNVCGKLKIWSNLKDLSRFLFPHYICASIVCCNRYSQDKGPKTKFGSIVLPTCLDFGCDIYMLPTDGPSFNNDIIEEGANPFKGVYNISALEPLLPF